MTPFEKAGYTHETRFITLADWEDIKKGEIVKLQADDGTIWPDFITEDGRAAALYLPGTEGKREELKVYTEEEQPEAKKIEKPKIIQIVSGENSVILGLGSNGVTYRLYGCVWDKYADGI